MRPSETPNSTPPGPLRLVQVGAGLMGRAWLGVISGSPDTELVGLVDLDLDVARRPPSADAASQRRDRQLAGPMCSARVAADAVVNVTVPAAHRAVSVEALRAGLPVLCEKPLAETVSRRLVHRRRGRAHRPVADGVAVAALLPPAADLSRPDCPSSARSGLSIARSTRPRTSAGSGSRWPTPCSSTWRSTSSTCPAI